jgi:hypothetical protein
MAFCSQDRIRPQHVALLALLAVVAAPTAAVAKPGSKEEAIQQGDPAGTAAAFDASSIYRYKGKAISEGDVVRLQLSCVQTKKDNKCADSPEQAEKEFALQTDGHARRGPQVRAADCGGGVSLQFQFEYRNANGSSTGLEARQNWYNNPGFMDNNTSSYWMGEHSGHFADYYNGNGYWYPGNTGLCAVNNTTLGDDPNWNNRISSRYRN